MGSKNNINSEKKAMNIGDITTIKDILFGQDIQSIENRFAEMDSKIGDANAGQQEDLAILKKETAEKLKAMDKRLADKLNDLEKHVNERVKDLEKQILNVSKSDKKSLAAMLQELSTNLIRGEK